MSPAKARPTAASSIFASNKVKLRRAAANPVKTTQLLGTTDNNSTEVRRHTLRTSLAHIVDAKNKAKTVAALARLADSPHDATAPCWNTSAGRALYTLALPAPKSSTPVQARSTRVRKAAGRSGRFGQASKNGQGMGAGGRGVLDIMHGRICV